MSPDHITLRHVDDCLVARVDSDNLLGVTEVGLIGGALEELLKDHPTKVVLDLTAVRYAGSAAIGMLISFSKSLHHQGGRLILCGTHHLDMLFRVSRTVVVFNIATDVDAAVKMLKK